MTHVNLFCAQESRPGMQQLVWDVWQRHFQSTSALPAGVLSATFDKQPEDSRISRLCFEFSDKQQLDTFELSVAFNNYIWDVLPLLVQHCTISCADGFTSDKAIVHARVSTAPLGYKLIQRIAAFFSVLHRPLK